MTTSKGAYRLSDQLFVWLLTDPNEPRLVGEIATNRNPRGVSFTYSAPWLEDGFALSEDLGLIEGLFVPREKDTAPGAVDDARPDRWGERVIRFVDKPPRLSLLEYLYFAGDDRFGALGISTSEKTYLPRRLGPLPTLKDAGAIYALVQKVLANEPIAENEKRLIQPGATMGGAHPKALLNIDDAQWVVKFADGDPVDTPLIEHASMTLARKAGIRVAATVPIRLIDGHAVAVERFDRPGNRRVHSLSANVVLKAAAEQLGYPSLAQVLRRRGVVEKGVNISQMRELFRRMVFNILIDNTDDHEKNHALLVDSRQHYELAPAFDVLPSGQALGYQQMIVGTSDADSTLENALSMHQLFALTKTEAQRELRKVSRVVDGWSAHFKSCGVGKNDLQVLGEHIDRPFLREQRADPP